MRTARGSARPSRSTSGPGTCRSSRAVPVSCPRWTTPTSIPRNARLWSRGERCPHWRCRCAFATRVWWAASRSSRSARRADSPRRTACWSSLLAGPAAVAVRNARLFRLQQEQNRHLESLLDTAGAITSAVTVEDSLAQICRTAAHALQTEECLAYEYDAGRDTIVCRAFYGVQGPPPALDEGGVYSLDDYPSDRAILGGRRGRAHEDLGRGPVRRRPRLHGGMGREGVSGRAAHRGEGSGSVFSCLSRRAASGSSAPPRWSSRAPWASKPPWRFATRACIGAESARTSASPRFSRPAVCWSPRWTWAQCSVRSAGRSPASLP